MGLQVLVVILTAILMLTGLLGSVLPILPGAPLILLGAFIYAWHTDFVVITLGTLIVLLILTLFSQALDYVASVIGAKKFGGSRWGMGGAFLGGIIGLFLGGILGIIIGPFLGALIFELIHGRGMTASFKIGLGTLVGFLGGALGKVVIAMIMIGIFLIKIMELGG